MIWTEDQVSLLTELYPTMGRQAVAFLLGRTEAQVRSKASSLGLKADKTSKHFREWQKRAARSKVGKKRPAQSEVMKRSHADGKLLKTPAQIAKMSVRMKKWHSKHRHPRGMLGLKHTPETLAAIGQKSQEAWENMTQEQRDARNLKSLKTRAANGTMAPAHPHGAWKAGWREIGGKRRYYRSRWEANYARYLEFLRLNGSIAAWEHEPDTFWFKGIKRGCVSYLPDFKVVENNGAIKYHEVKGWMDSKSQTKLRRMKKYHPTVIVVLIDAKEYKALARTAKSLVLGWE